MTTQIGSVRRRDFLRGSLVAAAMVPLGGTMASCAGSGAGPAAPQETEEATDTNPFGVPADSSVEAVIFNGGYGVDYVEFAAQIMGANMGVTPEITPSTAISTELQPRFVGGNPPDLIDNSGSQQIGFNAILSQLEDLTDVIDAVNYEGTPIRDTLYGGVLAPGTFGDKLAAINYVLTVYGIWYSASLFEENGWTVPTTWDEALELGAQAKEQDKYLFVWGKEAATYYQTMAIESAIMQGGDEVRLALENLEPECWSKPAMQDVFTKMAEAVEKGYFAPGGAGTQFTAAQAQWSNDQEALLYPSGAWIENEMKSQTADDFEMKGFPGLVVDRATAALPEGALHSTAGEPFIVPSQAANVAGAKELLRAMLSEAAATNFAKEKLAPTVVQGTVPADGFGSTALVSQTEMLEAAGENIFTFNFVSTYGMNADQLTVWNSFLDGSLGVDELTSRLQEITDAVANDDAVEKIDVQ
ncbi:N-acetylglucosamine/diacetylchitobiose ABC transporter substrate-binding protein [Auraticoccus monumenti]|uniref:Carbohydrate ABC transporter substrate-binding protein, CUT1 family n=1 Tax=Auraticoccus monumenti TaxID=675864 RepID=A0A1G6SFP2_9ACTN|nr:N-acetylglucosamine/diacetylchitobiose ABC transporter substrate-binding protein [Auraticoccus monumenti]SDD14925.1 carbohydrate ABC transporter substrate-binding protein, CUT1 family [Auraticoccus monumenti]